MKKLAWNLLRFALGGIFIYAGAVKAWNPSQFLWDVEGYRFLPYPLEVALALYLPWLEIICGSCLVIKKFHAGTLAMLIGLMMIFMVALASAWARDLDISCGCFEHHVPSPRYVIWLLRDAAILGALAILATVKRNQTPPSRWTSTEPSRLELNE